MLYNTDIIIVVIHLLGLLCLVIYMILPYQNIFANIHSSYDYVLKFCEYLK